MAIKQYYLKEFVFLAWLISYQLPKIIKGIVLCSQNTAFYSLHETATRFGHRV